MLPAARSKSGNNPCFLHGDRPGRKWQAVWTLLWPCTLPRAALHPELTLGCSQRLPEAGGREGR